jgi:hypothetical protein
VEPPEIWSQGVSDNQQATRKRAKKERKIGLGVQTMMMTKQKKKQSEANKANRANQERKKTTNLTAMVATYLAMGGSRWTRQQTLQIHHCQFLKLQMLLKTEKCVLEKVSAQETKTSFSTQNMVQVWRTDVKMRTLLSVEKCGCYIGCW